MNSVVGYLLCDIDETAEHKLDNGDDWTAFLLAHSKCCTPIGHLLCNIDETAVNKVENGDDWLI